MGENAVSNHTEQQKKPKHQAGRVDKNRKYDRRFKVLIVVMQIVLIVSIIMAVAIGPVTIPSFTVWKIALSHIPFLDQFISADWTNAHYNIVWEVRFPRVLLGVLVGAGLSLAGTGIQALVRNSLADPYILGVSSGASVGATLVILLGAFNVFGQYALSLAAFLGALITVVLVFSLAQVGNRISTTRLLLSGIALSMILSAVTDFIVISAPDDEKVHSALFWMMGSLVSANWELLPIISIAVVFTYIFLITQSRSLNLLLMGEETAVTLGLNIHIFRKMLIVVVSLLTGVLVAASGAIGFVGLMVPHIVRLLVGSDHKKVLTISLFIGALFMIWADVAARMLLAPEEIPIGVVTALTGGPFFIWLLRRSSYSFGGDG